MVISVPFVFVYYFQFLVVFVCFYLLVSLLLGIVRVLELCVIHFVCIWCVAICITPVSLLWDLFR